MNASYFALRTDRDQVAIRLAAYLGTLARIATHKPSTTKLRIATLVDRIGLSDLLDRPQHLQNLIEGSLDKLQDRRILKYWALDPKLKVPRRFLLADLYFGWPNSGNAF